MLPCRLSKLEPAALRLRMTQGVEWPDRSRPASDQGPVAICIPASGRPRFGIARKLRRVRRRISFQPLLWPMEQVMKCSRSIERDQQKWKPVLPDKRLRLSRDRALIFLKERMIFSSNRSRFADHALRNRDYSVISKCLPDSWSKMHIIVRPVHR